MKVFISWSGDKSREVGELLNEWIQCVLQAVTPWISSEDIEKGSLWFPEINDQFKDTSLGIICLTKANKEKPWILFEAGALAKGLTANRVCTFLIDLQPHNIKDPLAQFNHTLPTKKDLRKLVKTINIYLGEKGLKEKVLDQVFETYWIQFEERFKEIEKRLPDTTPPAQTESEDILTEILSVTRGLDKRLRNVENDSVSNDCLNKKQQFYSYTNKTFKKEFPLHWNNDVSCDETINFSTDDIMDTNLSEEEMVSLLRKYNPKIQASEIKQVINLLKVARKKSNAG